MKRFILIAVICALGFFQTARFTLEAAEDKDLVLSAEKGKSLTWGTPSNYLDIGLGYLFSRGHCAWEISYPDQSGRSRSALDFRGMGSNIPILFLDINHPNSLVSLNVQFGKGQSTTGEGTDTDYQSGTLFHRSRFDLTGDTAFWITDIQTTFASTSRPRWVLKPFLGWHHYEEKISMANGLWTTLYGVETNMPFDGLGSRYDFNWDALRMGIKGELELFTPPQKAIEAIKLKGQLAFFPFMHFRGRGVWNLRDDLKQDPSFSHEADNFGVLGMDGTLSLAYQPLKFLELECGARIFYFRVQDGTDLTFFSNDTIATVTLNEANALRIGLYLQITGRF